VSKKRGNGEGSITKRDDGRWMARYTVHTAKGPKRRTLFGRTRQEVATKLAKAMADRDGRIELDPCNVTVDEFLRRWLNDSVKGSVRPITFESYERLVRVHVVPAVGRIKPSPPPTCKACTGTGWMPGSRRARCSAFTPSSTGHSSRRYAGG
jgi:hypothetical protein